MSESTSISNALAAAERRNQSSPQGPSLAELAAQHDKRQKFRRLLDPGIMRPNSEPQAYKSLETLVKISDNLIREPDNPKYQRFKTTNTIIQEHIIKPKGTVEYAREMGFKPEIIDFQPYYSFNPSRMEDLKIGNMILKEAFELQTQKKERVAAAKASEKAVAQAAAEKIKMAFIDDRRTKEENDARERELRAARAARGVPEPQPRATGAPQASRTGASRARARPQIPDDLSDDQEEDIRQMPGTGRVLNASSSESTTTETPPPYEEDD